MQTDMSKSHLTSLDWREMMCEGQAECMAGALFLVNPVCLLSYQNSKLKTLWGLRGEVERLWL